MLIKKIQQCSYVFDFSDPMADLRAKEIKRAALNEVLDYIANNKGVITEPIYPEIIRMVGCCFLVFYNLLSICRSGTMHSELYRHLKILTLTLKKMILHWNFHGPIWRL